MKLLYQHCDKSARYELVSTDSRFIGHSLFSGQREKLDLLIRKLQNWRSSPVKLETLEKHIWLWENISDYGESDMILELYIPLDDYKRARKIWLQAIKLKSPYLVLSKGFFGSIELSMKFDMSQKDLVEIDSFNQYNSRNQNASEMGMIILMACVMCALWYKYSA
ncbi:MAG: hypothetical protein NTU89_00960 [Candidatus Dependentiae bacterium]|nr:hypothetical protein [Candidatus Dependentiae bacterium]